ncbi:MAG: sulfur transferase domain-containing protein [Gemmatimonadota bacterium]|nr:sulfur transferase domain-containing protein [Gemmatimonadota bacterium]
MKTTLLTAIGATLVLSSTSAAQKLVGDAPIKSLPTPVLLDTAGMFIDRYAKVGDDLYIAGQPTERALREMKAQGVTTVINLRMPQEMERVKFDEPKLIDELGMKYVYIPMRGGDGENAYSPQTLRKFADAIKAADGKVLLHCTVAWRASHIWAAYLIQEHGVADSVALAHARAINLMDDHRVDGSGRQPVEMLLGRKVAGLHSRQQSGH